jgi:hypothetical protein
MIQRGAANLRISEIRSALTIPPRSTRLHRILEMSVIRAVMATQVLRTKEELISALQRLESAGLLTHPTIAEIANYPEAVLLQAIQDVLADSGARSLYDFWQEEFEALRTAALSGFPPYMSAVPGDPPQFEVVRSQVRRIVGPGGHELRVTPVGRLRVVMVQTGYRRMDPLNRVVDCSFSDGERNWYPGVELSGEGVFVDMPTPSSEATQPTGFQPSGRAASAWFDAWVDTAHDDEMAAEDRLTLHPAFVWWHTLAHRLINALAIDSGYSPASVRERVYLAVDDSSGNAIGGTLLYTAQPGGDGTLGGLAALVPEFERVLQTALRNLESCSNDPLCGQESFGPGRYNGAACYACALVSETSCEHRNMHLDRNVLLENLP